MFLIINNFSFAQILDPCTNNYPNLPIAPLIAQNTIYQLNTSYTLTTNTTFSSNEIVIKNSGVQIVVPSGLILTIDATAIHACTSMWQGIKVLSGGRLVIRNNSIIEDALIGVAINNSTITNTGGLKIIDISTTTFNKNREAIVIENYVKNEGSNLYTAFSIRKSVFTSRNITYTRNVLNTTPTWQPTLISNPACLLAAPGFFFQQQSPNLNTPFVLMGLPYAPLLNGMVKPLNHIRLSNVGYTGGTNVGNATISDFIIVDNDTEPVLFDNADNGIYAENTNLALNICVFQNCKRGVSVKKTAGPTISQSYYSLRTLDNYGLPTVWNQYSCFFYDNEQDIYSLDYSWNKFLSNLFKSTQSNTNYSTTTWPPINTNTVGKVAIYVKTDYNAYTHINLNKIYNHFQGISINNKAGNTYNLSSSPYVINLYKFFTGVTDIDLNRIWSRPPSSTSTTAFCSNAIDASFTLGAWNASNNTTGVMPVQNPNLTIRNNIIDKVFRGVNINSYNMPLHAINVTTNTLNLALDPNTTITSSQHGIWVANSNNVYIKSNTVNGLVPNTTIPYTELLLNNTEGFRGRQTNYRMDNNQKQVITCNTSNNASFGFEFNGPTSVANTQWIQGNTLLGTHYYQLFLNNGALIGSQPASGATPMGNTFTTSVNLAKQTWTFNTFAVQSKIYVKPSVLPVITEPTLNSGSPLANAYSLISPQSIFPLNTATVAGCAAAPVPANTVVLNPGGASSFLLGTIIFPQMSASLNSMGQMYMYKMLDADNTNLTALPAYQTFYNTANEPAHVLRKMRNIEASINDSLFANAQILVNNFIPVNAIETNQKSFYNILIKYYTNVPLSSADQIELLRIAKECPHTDGACVYAARILSNEIALSNGESYKVFTDDCNPSGLYKVSSSQDNAAFQVTVSPNPTASDFTIQAANIANSTITVVDLLGRTQSFTASIINDSTCIINTTLAAGTYYVTVINPTYEEVTKMLIIK
jgi:hypothetical protein